MTVVRLRDAPLDGTAPVLLTAYGAYGQTLNADFSVERLPLLARGWGVALAHVRGGGELGRQCAQRPAPVQGVQNDLC
jgi:oligopeptidase B